MESPDNDTRRHPSPVKRRKRETVLKVIEQRTASGGMRWMISGLYVNGRRKREFFTSEDAAKRRVQMLRTARENTGTLADRIARKPEHAADAARAADLLAPFGLTVLEAAREFADCRQALEGTGLELVEVVKRAAADFKARRGALTLEALGQRFQNDPETLKLAITYRDDSRRRWHRFEGNLGPETLACDVTPDAVRRWLAGLAVADITKGNFHRTVGAVFAYAVHSGLIEENPFRKVKKPTVATKDGVEVFTPKEMAALLAAADRAWLPALVIGGFAGLRPEELRRLDWEEIDLRDAGEDRRRFIEVKASKSKTGQRRLVEVSPNLLAWLRPYAGESGRVVAPNERRHRLAAMKAAGVERWPVDVLRHSFASYHLAAHKDLNGTALELGHQSTKMLFQHYREAVTPEAARNWWGLMPAETAPNESRKSKGGAR